MLVYARRQALLMLQFLLRRCFAMSLFLLFGAALAHAQGGIVLVQHTSKDAGRTLSSSLAFPLSNTAGNWIGVVIRAGHSGQSFAVSDTRANTYRQAVLFNQTLDTPNGDTVAIFYAENIAGGANTVTVSESISNNTLRFAILEYSGLATSNSLDVTSTAAAQGNGTAANSGNATTAAGNLVLGAVMTANGATYTAGSGYTIEERVPAAPNTKLIVEDQIQGTAGGIAASATLSPIDSWGAAVAAFKAAGGTGGTASSITATAGTPQSTAINAAFATQLQATVKDSLNNPVSGVAVTFAAPASGASGIFPGSVTSVTVNTVASGVATAPIFTANSVAGGPYIVTATVAGVATPANFSLTNTAVPPSTMTANAGTTPQSATISTAFANTLAVTVKDAGSNPVSGVNVTFTAPGSGASGVFSNSTATITVATNGSGVASAPFTANATAGGPYTVTAAATGLTTVNFSLTNTAGAASTMTANAGTTPQSATISTAFANALAVTVKDAGSNPVSGVNVTFTAPGSGASGVFSNSTATISVATNASGVASAPFTANATTGGPYTVTAAATGLTTVNFSLTNTAVPPSTMTVNAGTTPQSATISTAFANALAVTVKDAGSNPVSGVNVTFTAPGSGASGVFSNSTATITVATNGLGVASAPFTANATAGGPYTVTAAATGLTTVNFSLTNTAGAASTMTANAGTTPQSATISTAFANALAVTVKDAGSNPVSGVNVTFTAPGAGASGVFSNSTATISVATNASGVASAPFTANATAGGPYTVTVAATGLTTVNFSLTNLPPGTGGIALVQHASKDAGTTTSSTLAFPSSNTAGNFIAVVIRAGRSGEVFTVTDSRRNTYHQAVQFNVTVDAPNGDTLGIFYAENIGGGANTITVSDTISSTLRFAIMEYSGVALANSLDGTTAQQGSSASPNSGNLTTVASGDLLLGAILTGNPASFAAGSGYAIEEAVPAQPNTKLIAEDQIQLAAGTGSASALLSGSNTWAAALAAFKSVALNVAVSPKRAAVTMSALQTVQFTGTVFNDPSNSGVTWSVDNNNGGTAASGTVSATGLYTPGTQPGVHIVTATSVANAGVSASSSVAVTDLAGVYMHHNDVQRTGQNLQEYALTPANVGSSAFTKLFSCPVDGYVYAQPLWVANLIVGGANHNVVFIATEHDSVYAFDADSPSCLQLWKTSFLGTGVTTMAWQDTANGATDLIPEIGITSTPVIDPVTKTIYVVAKTKETIGTGCSMASPCFVNRLHALDITTGAEKLGGPVVISAPNFDPLRHFNRPALLLSNGTVYVAFGSHADGCNWQGWLFGYDPATLAQTFVRTTSDPTSGCNGAALWNSGAGPAADASGNIYVITGNGNYNGTTNFSESTMKFSPTGSLLDWFTPFNQSVLDANDVDMGSAGVLILPDSVASAAHPHLALATGKIAVLYLLDISQPAPGQTKMGKFNSTTNNDVQEVIPVPPPNTTLSDGGNYVVPAFWNGNIYTTGQNYPLSQFTIANGSISTPAFAVSTNRFPPRGGTPAVSASGTTNGVVWILDLSGWTGTGSAVLYAYDATNVANMFYRSPTSGTGAAGAAVKFTVPTVANGKVYVGGQTTVTVFGLLPN